MKTRQLGTLEVSSIGLGCMSMSQAYGTPDRQESIKALHRALDIGYTLLDTASIYGAGHNEKLIGETLAKRRREYVLASKCGIVIREGKRAIDGSPANIRQTCEQSLRNLQTDTIDLYYLHRKDPSVPIEESVGELARLRDEGKIAHIGLSEVSSTTLRQAVAEAPIAAVQSEYSLWTRDPERKVLQTCGELGVGFVPFSPLGRAFLSGKITQPDQLEETDLRKGMPRFREEHFDANLALIRQFGNLAKSTYCTPAQLALAWLLHQSDFIVPIPGTKRVSYVEENAQAADLQISRDVLEQAGILINPETVQGDRYAKAQMMALDPEQ